MQTTVAVASADPDDPVETTGSLPVRPGLALVNAPLPPRRPQEFAAGALPTSLFAATRRIP